MTQERRTVRHAVGALESFPQGEIRIVEVADRSIGIINAGDTIYAVLNVCPHERAPICTGTLLGTMMPSPPGQVEYGLKNRILRCPWHGYEFDLANGGKNVFTTYKGRLQLFPVSIESGQVWVEIRETAEIESASASTA